MLFVWTDDSVGGGDSVGDDCDGGGGDCGGCCDGDGSSATASTSGGTGSIGGDVVNVEDVASNTRQDFETISLIHCVNVHVLICSFLFLANVNLKVDVT